mmetsp:Transcript_89692/g.192230  ORF Transcript_89692/g.192230 Transcript_89692/m.192230 type:complete len:394 (+) Transcript_89692:138-1319(+)
MVISAELGENFCWIALAYSLALATQPTAASGPLAVKIEQGLGPGNIFQLKELREKILRSNPTDEEWGNRNFGLGGVGHETLYLHRHLDDAMPHLRQRLLDLAIRADEIAGWNATSGAELAARCLELIRYEGSPMDKKKAASIGWHNDGATLVTLVAMLSNADEYEGGALEFRNGAITEQYVLAVGDVLAWRGWTQHRVVPVTRGSRDVFVVEWWLGEDCTTSFEPRGSDSVEGLRNALLKDPNFPNLHRLLGEALCLQLPCSDAESAAAAEAEYRKAVALAPRDAAIVHSLGYFLLGSSGYIGIVRRAEGVRYFREAHELDDAIVGPVPEELDNLENIVNQVRNFLLIAMCLAILGFGIKYLERLESSMGASAAARKSKKPDNATKKEVKKNK